MHSHCVCALAPRLDLATRVLVVMHAREWRKASNTGHFVRLALKNSDVRLHGLPHQPVDLADVAPLQSSTLVLYPGCGAKPLTKTLVQDVSGPFTLLVPDGNWQQARNMMRRVATLRKVQPVELPGPVLMGARPRRNVFKDRMSTFEAIAQALGILENNVVEDQLLAFFQATVGRMLQLRGKRLQAAPSVVDATDTDNAF